MKDTTRISLISKLIMIFVFLGIYSTSILIFKIPNSPMVLILALMALVCAYFIVKFAVMGLVKIFLEIVEGELMRALRAANEEERLINRITAVQKEIRKNMPTIH